MLDTLRILAGPYLLPMVGGSCLVGLAAMALASALDRRQRLAAITAMALQRADVTQDYIHHVTKIPKSKLSEQLGGKSGLTALYRLFESEVIERETDFCREWIALMADVHGFAIVPKDWSALLEKVDALIGGRKSMVKARIAGQEQAS